jgi:hypothetical protein
MNTEMNTEMNEEQVRAIKCAYADLVWSLQSFHRFETTVHDWEGHLESIKDLEKAFSFIEPIDVEVERM